MLTIYFDLDGPILDISERCFRVHRQIIGGTGAGAGLDREAFWTLKRHRASVADLIARSGTSLDERTYRRQWLERIEDPAYLRYDALVPGAAAVLTSMRQEYELVLVTLRRHRLSLERQLEALGLRDIFHDVRSAPADDEQPWRVKARLVRQAPRGRRARGVIVGDTEADILAGQALGLMTVATANGIRTRTYLEALRPDVVLDDVTTLAAVLPARAHHVGGTRG